MSRVSATTRPRFRDYLAVLWCLVFDSIGALGGLYRMDKSGPGVAIGAFAQRLWYRAHNNRFYDWMTEDGSE